MSKTWLGKWKRIDGMKRQVELPRYVVRLSARALRTSQQAFPPLCTSTPSSTGDFHQPCRLKGETP